MKRIWARRALLGDSWAKDVLVSIDKTGRIVSLEQGQNKQGAVVENLLPAPVNAHSHAFQRAMAGLTEQRGPDPSDSFWSWRKLMYRFLDHLSPDHVQAITAYVQMEMLEAGYATNTEFHYLHHQPGGDTYGNLAEMSERVMAAAGQSGIGLTLLPVLYQRGGCDGRSLTGGQVRFGNDMDRYCELVELAEKALDGLPDDANIGVAPHSLRAVSPGDLRQAANLRPANPVHLHLAEQIAEVTEVVEHLGERPVAWLLDNFEVDERWCLIHCTQMEPSETAALAKTGAVVGVCPITESNLGDGIFDGLRWLDYGGRLALGSDSNVRISLTEEIRTLDYSQRLRDRSRAALASKEKSTGRRIFDTICHGGAQAAGRDTGRITVGAWADLMAIDCHPNGLADQNGDTMLDYFAFAGDNRMITDVWSAGRHMVQGSRHVKRDEITGAYADTMQNLRDHL